VQRYRDVSCEIAVGTSSGFSGQARQRDSLIPLTGRQDRFAVGETGTPPVENLRPGPAVLIFRRLPGTTIHPRLKEETCRQETSRHSTWTANGGTA